MILSADSERRVPILVWSRMRQLHKYFMIFYIAEWQQQTVYLPRTCCYPHIRFLYVGGAAPFSYLQIPHLDPSHQTHLTHIVSGETAPLELGR